MRGKITFRLALILAFVLCQAMVFPAGNPDPPRILDKSGSQHFSPDGDGVRDIATIEFEVELYVKSNKDGYIPEATVRIADRSGNVIREIKHTEESDVGWFEGIFVGYKKFNKKAKMTWNGKNEDGTVVQEGTYDFILTVKDGSDQPIDVTLEKAFVVDMTAPEITKIVIDSPFSPNEDGRKDKLIVRQDGSEEALWVGTIENLAGVLLKEFSWKDSRPKDFEWDGVEDDGSQYEYGIYQYRLASADLAGNRTGRVSETTIVLDNAKTSIGIAADPTIFSPNGDNVKEVVAVSLTTEVVEGVASWKVAVADKNGRVRRSFEGTQETVEELIFDGNDDSGARLPEGEYWISYSIDYLKGDHRDEKTVVSIDVTDPSIDLYVKNPIFSPNGDGIQDKAEVHMKSSEIVTWEGMILDPEGRTLLTKTSEETTSLIVLDGLNPASGEPVPDGIYRISISFTDRAGNRVEEERELEVDNTPPQISVSAEPTLFSPDGDGNRDTVTVSMSSSEPVRGTADIIDPSGRSIISTNVAMTTGETIILDEMAAPTMPLVNGIYKIVGRLGDAAGNWVEPEAVLVTRDNRPTPINVTVPVVFSPNRDGVADSVQIGLEPAIAEGVLNWQVDFEDSVGRAMKSFSGTGPLPDSIEWDGSVNGQIASEGSYRVRVRAEYEKGNRPESLSDSFIIDLTPPSIELVATTSPFVKVDSKVEGEAFITLRVYDESGVESWNLDIVTPDGEIVRSYTGQGSPSDKIIWKGEAPKSLEEQEELIMQVEVYDKVGNTRTHRQPLPFDIVVYRQDGKLYLLVPNVNFGAYKYTLDSVSSRKEERNWSAIKRVVNVYRKYPSYGLLLEGHALNIYRGQGGKAVLEERILLPLTQRRAEAVKEAMVRLGMDADNIEVSYFGGTRPIVSTSDKMVWWKNRRVEFIMLEPEE